MGFAVAVCAKPGFSQTLIGLLEQNGHKCEWQGDSFSLPATGHADVLIFVIDDGSSGLYMYDLEKAIEEYKSFFKRVVVVSRLLEPLPVQEFQSLVKIGVRGFFSDRSDFEQFNNCLRNVVGGGAYIDSKVGDFTSLVQRRNKLLTPREAEVLVLLARGLTMTKIAKDLGVSQRTILECRERIRDTLKISTVEELVVYAISEGLV